MTKGTLLSISIKNNCVYILEQLLGEFLMNTTYNTNAILCDGCERWVHKKCSGIKGRLLPDSVFRCARCLGTARAIDERQFLEAEVGNKKLEFVSEFCYLGDMLSAGGGYKLAAKHAANAHGARSGNCIPFSPTAKCPF